MNFSMQLFLNFFLNFNYLRKKKLKGAPDFKTCTIKSIGGKPGWWLLLFLIPFVNLIFIIWTYNMISKSFGKDEGFTIGLTLLGFIFWPILGFGDATYKVPYGQSST